MNDDFKPDDTIKISSPLLIKDFDSVTQLAKSKTTLWQLAKKFHRRVSTKLNLRREKSKVISISTEPKSLRQSRTSLRSANMISNEKSVLNAEDDATTKGKVIQKHIAKLSTSSLDIKSNLEGTEAIGDMILSNTGSSPITAVDKCKATGLLTKTQSPNRQLKENNSVDGFKKGEVLSDTDEESCFSKSISGTETETDFEIPQVYSAVWVSMFIQLSTAKNNVFC